MDSSTKLLWDDPGIYTESCGVMDPIIHDLDQQIILNDMILSANGGMPYVSPDPVIPSNPPPVINDSWQFYQNPYDGSSSLLPAPTHPQQQTQTAASSSQMMLDAELCDRSREPPPPPSLENPGSHHPHTRALNYRHDASAGGPESTGSSDGVSGYSNSASASASASTPATSSSSAATSISATLSSHSKRQDGTPPASTSVAAAAPGYQDPRRKPNINLAAGRRAVTTREKKKLYHYQQQQQHGRMLAAQSQAAAVAHLDVTAAVAEAAKAEAEAARMTTGPPERHLDLTQRDMSTAVRQVAEMGNHLQNAAHEQRKLVDDTLNQWTGNAANRV